MVHLERKLFQVEDKIVWKRDVDSPKCAKEHLFLREEKNQTLPSSSPYSD